LGNGFGRTPALTGADITHVRVPSPSHGVEPKTAKRQWASGQAASQTRGWFCWLKVTGPWEAVDRTLPIRCAGQCISTCSLQPLVPHEFGDEDEIVAATNDGGAEGVPEDVTGEIVSVDAGVLREAGPDVAGTAHPKSASSGVQEQGGIGVGPGPARSSSLIQIAS
jgi:hypothetical protein